jgi:hypothetical protein
MLGFDPLSKNPLGTLSASGTWSEKQASFRFRTDAGAVDATPTWGAAENSNSYDPNTGNFRLRVAVANVGTGDSPTATYSLYVSKNAGAYTLVTTVSADVQSVAAGSDTDETALLLPKLTDPL